MARASARLRASGFSQAMPRSLLPPFTALWIACMVATRVSLGERIQSASTSFAWISLSSEPWAVQGPRPSSFARLANALRLSFVGL